jgi:hypothetical protein
MQTKEPCLPREIVARLAKMEAEIAEIKMRLPISDSSKQTDTSLKDGWWTATRDAMSVEDTYQK